MSQDFPIVSIIKRGCRKFPRVIVAKGDEYKNPIYWTGSDWSADEGEAMVFANVNDASWVCHDVLMNCVEGLERHCYVLPLYVELHGDKPNIAELRSWLKRAMRIVVDSPKHGLGPEQGTFGFLIADTDDIKGE